MTLGTRPPRPLPTIYTPDRLRALRERAHLSKLRAAAFTGVSRWSIALIEQGRTRPRYSTLDRLLACYTLRINTLEQRERNWNVRDSFAQTTDRHRNHRKHSV